MKTGRQVPRTFRPAMVAHAPALLELEPRAFRAAFRPTRAVDLTLLSVVLGAPWKRSPHDRASEPAAGSA